LCWTRLRLRQRVRLRSRLRLRRGLYRGLLRLRRRLRKLLDVVARPVGLGLLIRAAHRYAGARRASHLGLRCSDCACLTCWEACQQVDRPRFVSKRAARSRQVRLRASPLCRTSYREWVRHPSGHPRKDTGFALRQSWRMSAF
jgi:hypothetical protein